MTGPSETRVFVVDDDEAVRDSLLVLLGNKGFATMAYDSAEAFLASHQSDAKGCVLLDIRMPGMDGMTLLRQLASRRASLPVILMTGHGDVPTAVRAMRIGAFDFLEKPFPQEVICEAVQRALASVERSGRPDGPAGDAQTRLGKLTGREREVLERIVTGATNKEIARDLEISPRTVEIHRSRVMEKMETPTLSHLVRVAIAAGIGASA